MIRRITEEKIRNYEKFLYEDEKAPVTVKKYICDIGRLREYAVVKLNKIQEDVFCEEDKYLTKAEYKRLTKEVLKQGKVFPHNLRNMFVHVSMQYIFIIFMHIIFNYNKCVDL